MNPVFDGLTADLCTQADLLCSAPVRSLYGFFQHPGSRVFGQPLFWIQSQDLIRKIRALFRLFVKKERLLEGDISQRGNQGFGMMCFYGPRLPAERAFTQHLVHGFQGIPEHFGTEFT